MGLEMKARNGRLVYVRETGRIDDPEPPRGDDTPPFWLVVGVLVAVIIWLLTCGN